MVIQFFTREAFQIPPASCRYQVALVEGGQEFTYRVTVGGTHRSEDVRKVFVRNNQKNMDFFKLHYSPFFEEIAERIRRCNRDLLLPARLDEIVPRGEALVSACSRNDSSAVREMLEAAPPSQAKDMVTYRDSRAFRVRMGRIYSFY